MKLVVLSVCSVLTLVGCSSVKEGLGLERNTPDEFSVVERAPLTMPPNFNLSPPTPGVMRPQESTTAMAEGLVLGSTSSAPKANATTTVSKAENTLLQKAGANAVSPSIRQQLEQEKDSDAPKSTAEKLGIVPTSGTGKALNPKEEALRLKEKNVKTVPVKPTAANEKK